MEYGRTIVCGAVDTGETEFVRVLTESGADPSAAPGGFPLLDGPVNENHLEVVRLLLAAGARLGEDRQSLIEAAKKRSRLRSVTRS